LYRGQLPLQAEGWDFHAEGLLEGIPVEPGWTCLDLGCGPAGILVLLSRRVGPAGFVVGVEVDARHLAAARALVQDTSLTNVEILKRDIYDTQLPREPFDFVHARLANASNERHEDLLAELLALVRAGGVVALQCTAWADGKRSRSIEVWGASRCGRQEIAEVVQGDREMSHRRDSDVHPPGALYPAVRPTSMPRRGDSASAMPKMAVSTSTMVAPDAQLP
jgi:trans-aconitate methyltransferase